MQARQQRQQGGGPRHHDLEFALQRLQQTGPAQGFSVQTFSGQEQDRKVGRVRGRHVLGADRLCFFAQLGFDAFGRQFNRCRVSTLVGVKQTLVVFTRELGVDGQPQGLAICTLAGQAHGKFNALVAARNRRHIGGVLLWREHLFQQTRQLHLTKNAAGFDVGQHTVECANIAGQSLHFTQALVHLLQAVGHLFEALAQALFKRGVQLLVHRHTHLFELLFVALLQSQQPLLDRLAHLVLTALIGLGQQAQLLCQVVAETTQRGVHLLLHASELHAERIDLFVLRACHVAALGEQYLLQAAELCACGQCVAAQLVAQFAFQLAPGCGVTAPERQPQHQQQGQHDQGQQHQDGPFKAGTHGAIVSVTRPRPGCPQACRRALWASH